MMRLFSIEFWIVLQLCFQFLIVLLVWGVVRKLGKLYSDPAMKKDYFNTMAESVYRETLEKLEYSTDTLADKAAVQMIDRATQDIIDLLDPLVKGAEAAADTFDSQIKEKKRLIRELNDALDSRIISINLLLSRAEVLLNNQGQFSNSYNSSRQSRRGGGNMGFSGLSEMSDFRERDVALREDAIRERHSEDDVFDQQQKIVELYQEGMDVETIASRLSMPQGEVQLVINLKEKFIQMEKQF
ncbi:conserved hypothetical protein [Desulfamplus magnetovallimortis]|uniref:Uncharacterized protein n=1 Tax=Desulfamplus magnetovallimortis TaxID=1246637 RepID=A0A1W1H9S0_9BACT|nr:hypothetical protein [Desulfamplus magnetovallimortis]SLM29237.1 conserved hypothetical protein [Desulfamplus magnetovallimortis]